MPSPVPSPMADPLEGLRHRATYWLLPLGALAFIGTGLMLGSQMHLVDRYCIPVLAVLMVVLELALWRKWLSVKTVWQITLVVVASYVLLALTYETASGFSPGLSPTTLWFPVAYLITFVIFPPAQAMRLTVLYYLLGMAAMTVGTVLSPNQRLGGLNDYMQFALSNLAYIVLIGIYNRLRTQFAQMQQMAHSDPLTGVSNRRHMQSLLEQELSRAERYHQPFSLLLLDLDRFKQVNDVNGHAIGDQVLREVALLLDNTMRESDALSRWGGEEFLVLAPATDLTQAVHLAQRLNLVVAGSRIAGGLHITVSVGVACYELGDSLEKMLQRADVALYRAKSSGRNRVEVEIRQSHDFALS